MKIRCFMDTEIKTNLLSVIMANKHRIKYIFSNTFNQDCGSGCQMSGSENNVPGLVYVPDFITGEEEAELVSHIDDCEWRNDLARRVQHYGWRYDYTKKRIDNSMRLGDLPPWAESLNKKLLESKLITQLADQVIVNEYTHNQGINKHIDCVPCFDKEIVTISLLESCEMIFKQYDRVVKQLLEQRSAAVMTEDARYKWAHEIPKISRTDRRISITLRKVLIND